MTEQDFQRRLPTFVRPPTDAHPWGAFIQETLEQKAEENQYAQVRMPTTKVAMQDSSGADLRFLHFRMRSTDYRR